MPSPSKKAVQVARGGGGPQNKQSRVGRGGNQSPAGDLGALARDGGYIPLNPNSKNPSSAKG